SVGRKGIRVTVLVSLGFFALGVAPPDDPPPVVLTVLVWLGFFVLVASILAFDIGVFSRESKTLSAKTALFRTGVYFVLAMLFTAFVYFAYENKWFELGVGGDPNDPG